MLCCSLSPHTTHGRRGRRRCRWHLNTSSRSNLDAYTHKHSLSHLCIAAAAGRQAQGLSRQGRLGSGTSRSHTHRHQKPMPEAHAITCLWPSTCLVDHMYVQLVFLVLTQRGRRCVVLGDAGVLHSSWPRMLCCQPSQWPNRPVLWWTRAMTSPQVRAVEYSGVERVWSVAGLHHVGNLCMLLPAIKRNSLASHMQGLQCPVLRAPLLCRACCHALTQATHAGRMMRM